jgi:hypothetical protein
MLYKPFCTWRYCSSDIINMTETRIKDWTQPSREIYIYKIFFGIDEGAWPL